MCQPCGYLVEVTSYVADVKGYLVNVMGYIVYNNKGYLVDVKDCDVRFEDWS